MAETRIPTLVEYALWYASRGWHVFPLKPRGKLPIISKDQGGEGFHDATTSREQIEAWWTRWPNANVGIATGVSGLVVLDVDGPEGADQLREVSGGVLPPTLCATTGRTGGLHIYYKGTGIPSSQRKGEKLDVRGSSGYVVAPGSIHENGTVYAWTDQQVPLADVPDWVALWVRSRGREPAVSSLELPNGNSPSLSEREKPGSGKRRLADRALDGLSGGEPFSWDEARRLASALASIPADVDGKTWFSYLGALHALEWIVEGNDVGFEIADKWSSTSKGQGAGNGEYRGRGDVLKRWEGFNKEFNGVKCTVASIYADAKARGWVYQIEVVKPIIANGHNGIAAIPASLRADSNAIHFPDTDKYGKPKATCANAQAALRMLGVDCAYDQFHDRMQIEGYHVGQWLGDLTDNAVHMLRVVIRQQYHFDPGNSDMFDAIVQEALQHAYDPVQDYLDCLKWDGKARLDTWMTDYLSAELTPFNCAAGRLALVAAVRRARQPGYKFDQILVLEGPEGRGKSSAIELLAGAENFSDQSILTLDDKGQQEALQGVWLYEIADLAGHSRAEVERVKTFASRTCDRARPAYGRSRLDRPRRCVFFATTNNDTYLKSQTGNRRFWPVRCGTIGLEELGTDRDQLWAEAALLEKTASLILPSVLWGDAAIEQDSRREHDPWDDLLEGTLGKLTDDGREHRVSTSELMNGRLKLPVERQNDVTAKRLAFTMRRLGWDGPKVYRDGKATVRGYTKEALLQGA